MTTRADSLAAGESRQFTASVTENGVQVARSIDWSSSDLDVATVSSTGLVSALRPGLVTIHARSGLLADSARVRISSRYFEIVVVPGAAQVLVGDSLQVAIASTGDALGPTPTQFQDIRWSVDDPTIATISPDGVLLGTREGEVTLVAQTPLGAAYAQVQVQATTDNTLLLEPANASVVVGESTTLTATVLDDRGRVMRKEVRWTSSDDAIATVSNGVVKGLKAGSVMITASTDRRRSTAVVSVTSAPVATLSVSLASGSIAPGQTTQASVQLRDAEGNTLTGKTIAWQSSNPSIATVDASGLVKGIAAGDASIKAIADAKVGSAAIVVRGQTTSSVAISPASPSAAVGKTAQLSAEARDASGAAIPGKTATWSSANTAVATVSSSGLVTAVSAGSAQISATIDGVKSTVTFSAAQVPVARVSVTPATSSLNTGKQQAYVAAAYDASGNLLNGRTVRWSSTKPTIATVDAAGTVSALAAGSSEIVADIEGVTGAAALSVSASEVIVASVTVRLNAASITVGQSVQAVAEARDASGALISGRAVNWSVSDGALASVDANGLVRALAAGTVVVGASIDGKSGSTGLTVGPAATYPVGSVTLTFPKSSIAINESMQATAVIRDTQGNIVTNRTVGWSSSNPAIVKVNGSGLLTGIAPGTAMIVVGSEGKYGEAPMTVAAAGASVSTITVTLQSSSMTPGATQQATAVARDGAGNVIGGKTFTWSSSNIEIASVSSTGVISASRAGTIMITAAADGRTGTAGLNVTSPTSTVSSVTVSLPALSMLVGQSSQATATVRASDGTVVSGKVPAWSVASGYSTVSINGSGVVTALSAGPARIVATVDGKTGTLDFTVAAPSTTPPPTGSDPVGSLMGPYPSVSAVNAMGGVFARYESDWATEQEKQWASCGPKWDCINYYDRAEIYYVWWQRTGDTKYRDRAHQVALNFRQQYLEPNNYGLSHHWAMMDGIALHYLTTGDPASLKAIGMVADNFAYLVSTGTYIASASTMDNRIQAYALKSLLLAYKLNAPSVGTPQGHPGGNNWATVLRTALTKILATRDADGQWRGAKCGTAGRATHPFTVGLLYDGLVRYYDLFEKDARIPAAIKTSADVMWRDDWLAASNAFKYVGIDCPGEGGTNPAPDLNNLIVNGFGFIWRTTGDATYRSRADLMVAGAINSGATYYTKQFNQIYTSSYRYLAWR